MEQNHSGRYLEGDLKSHTAYHYLIEKDGSIAQKRAENEKTGHTRNQRINLSSIAIALAGDFTQEKPTSFQISSLQALVSDIKERHGEVEVILHREASPTACPAIDLINYL